ncbi:MAG: hypothetical protein M3011_01220, partial [Actinomycetota bacterium]|nr:hypothetical protein [Actinomycetota bacterium]
LVVAESPGREVLGKCFNRLVQLTLIPGVYDTQCGAKVASTAVWRRLLPHCHEDGFAWDVEAVAVARRLGLPVHEIGVRWSHDRRSSVRPWRDGMAMVRAVPRIRRGVRAVPSSRAAAPGAVPGEGDVVSPSRPLDRAP